MNRKWTKLNSILVMRKDAKISIISLRTLLEAIESSKNSLSTPIRKVTYSSRLELMRKETTTKSAAVKVISFIESLTNS